KLAEEVTHPERRFLRITRGGKRSCRSSDGGVPWIRPDEAGRLPSGDTVPTAKHRRTPPRSSPTKKEMQNETCIQANRPLAGVSCFGMGNYRRIGESPGSSVYRHGSGCRQHRCIRLCELRCG